MLGLSRGRRQRGLHGFSTVSVVRGNVRGRARSCRTTTASVTTSTDGSSLVVATHHVKVTDVVLVGLDGHLTMSGMKQHTTCFPCEVKLSELATNDDLGGDIICRQMDPVVEVMSDGGYEASREFRLGDDAPPELRAGEGEHKLGRAATNVRRKYRLEKLPRQDGVDVEDGASLSNGSVVGLDEACGYRQDES